MPVIDFDQGKALLGNLNRLLDQIRPALYELRKIEKYTPAELNLLYQLECQEEATLRTIQDLINYLATLEPSKLDWIE